jgi:hypothetical protein
MTNPKPLYALASFLILTVALPGCATVSERGSNAADDAKSGPRERDGGVGC